MQVFKGASGLCTSWVKHSDFHCFKGVTYGAGTLCYKLTSVCVEFCCFLIVNDVIIVNLRCCL